MEASQIIEHQSKIGHAALQVHNSKLPINRVYVDILYNIFVSAVHESQTPVETALIISHVCQHWRTFALKWPALWAFLDLDTAPPLVDLFMSRSGNSPLALSWTMSRSWERQRRVGSDADEVGSYCWSIANPNDVSPRLRSLTLHLYRSQFTQIRNVLRNPDVPPLQPRHLNIGLLHSEQSILTPPGLRLMDLARVDPSCLQELELHALDLPWLELPHNKLTHFTLWRPTNPPKLSHLLRFLSSCPFLRELEIMFTHLQNDKASTDMDDPITRSITKLEFPELKRLRLETLDRSGYGYIREVLARIQYVTPLSNFSLRYENGWAYASIMSPDTTTRDVFEIVPSWVLSNFKNHHVLHVNITCRDFRIYSAESAFNYAFEWPPDSSFQVTGSRPQKGSKFRNHFAPVLDMIRAMPAITYLGLSNLAWQLPWVADIPSLFPYLDTLRLANTYDISDALNSLPAGLRLKRLILSSPLIPFPDGLSAVLNVVLNAGVEILEIHAGRITKCEIIVMETIMRQRGVVVSIDREIQSPCV